MPAVEGFTYNLIPSAQIPWAQLDLPEDTDGFGLGVTAAGAPVGSLFVVDSSDFQTYVDRLFDDPTAIERGPATPGAPAATASEARIVWRSFGGTPVASATLGDSGVGRWVWGHDGLTWVATGSLTMEELIGGVIAQQQAATPSDPHDYSQLAGPLLDRWLQGVPGYLFVDQPVAATLEQIPNTLAGDCAERLYLGHVAPLDDPDPLPMVPDDLAVVAATIAGVCADVGFFDDLDGAMDAMALRDDVISGVAVRRNDTNIVVIDGEDVIHISSSEPATLVEMEPFINSSPGNGSRRLSTSTRSPRAPACSVASNAPTIPTTVRSTRSTAPHHIRARCSVSSTSNRPRRRPIPATDPCRRSATNSASTPSPNTSGSTSTRRD